jgi:predicted nucleotidyltransferase
MSRLTAAAKDLNLQPLLPVPLSALEDIDTLRRWHTERHRQAIALRSDQLAGVTVDVLLFPPVDPNDMVKRAQQLVIAGVPVALACIDDLIALKQSAGRPIDLADIEHLKRLQTP